MPQIYFEDFSFGSAHEEEVNACVAANQALLGMKLLLPVRSSEDGAKTPATATELQYYLDRFEGSSIWRIPERGERGEAWNLRYDGASQRLSDLEEAVSSIAYVVRPGASGREVGVIRQLLSGLGYPSSGPVDEFNADLKAAVERFQTTAGIAIDGKVGPETISALTGNVPPVMRELGLRERLAVVAEHEGNLRLRWKGADKSRREVT
ncbi:MAG TPA: peptidoglycan-binding domain-containing protein [Candidatus Binataceae bacterium]|nr:peptidoglycan-binding domain-containing protein [Candidatus Binataceae bacterium]